MKAKKIEKLFELMRRYDSLENGEERASIGVQIDDIAEKMSDFEIKTAIMEYNNGKV